jgi:ABC-type ATPase involved in cell division
MPRAPSRLATANEQLLKKARAAVNRELRHIDDMAKKAKLDPSVAKDLVNYFKVLNEATELAQAQAKAAKKDTASMSTAELESLMKGALGTTNS